MRIRSHLIILVLGATLPILAFSAVVTAVFWRQQRIAFEQRFLERVRALSVALDAELDGHIQVLQVLARSQLLQTGDLREFYDRSARVSVGQTAWSTMFLADANGHELFDLRQPFGAEHPLVVQDLTIFATVVNAGQPAVSRLFRGPTSEKGATAVVVPVKKDGAVRYILGAVIDSSAWLNFLSRYPVSGGATMTLLDQQVWSSRGH